jgi:hypothetical protein
MARPSKILAAGLALLSLCLFFVQKSKPEIGEEHLETLTTEEHALLREGDFVFRLGYGMVSFFFGNANRRKRCFPYWRAREGFSGF